MTAPGPPGRASRPVLPLPWTRLLSCFFSIVTGLGLLSVLILFVLQSLPAWRHGGIGYLTGTRWHYRLSQFGSAPMIYGTLVVSFIAVLLAAPVAVGAAIFTAEYVPEKFRMPVKLLVELLAGIPSVVYGLLGILFLRNWIYHAFAHFDLLSGDTLLTAGVLLAVMILPTIMTLTEDSFRGVAKNQRLAARGLGLSQGQTFIFVTLPQARHGIFAAILLALGRALGETIAVFLVVGRQDNQWPRAVFDFTPVLRAGQTLTTKLGGSETNIAYGSSLHWAAMVGLVLILLLLVGAITSAGLALFRKGVR